MLGFSLNKKVALSIQELLIEPQNLQHVKIQPLAKPLLNLICKLLSNKNAHSLNFLQGSYSLLDFFISTCKNNTYVSLGFTFHLSCLVKDTQRKKVGFPCTYKTLLYPAQVLNYWIKFLSNLKVNPFSINHLQISSIYRYFY